MRNTIVKVTIENMDTKRENRYYNVYGGESYRS